ncbi:MAG TPA: hypothetical protein VGH19_05020 [Verrucomicrobiae bacterium]
MLRHPLLGFFSSLAALTFIYIVAWVTDIGGPAAAIADDGYPLTVIFVPAIAIIFSTVAFLVAVLPQALLARLIVNRFKCQTPIPYLLLFAFSALIITPIAFQDSTPTPLWTLFWGIAYLLTGSSVLWWISFRHILTK